MHMCNFFFAHFRPGLLLSPLSEKKPANRRTILESAGLLACNLFFSFFSFFFCGGANGNFLPLWTFRALAGEIRLLSPLAKEEVELAAYVRDQQ